MKAPLANEILDALSRHLGAVVRDVRVSDLAGGFTDAAVRRVDLSAGGRRAAFVVKTCPPAEAAVMAAIASQGAETFPMLVARGDTWFAAPFYEGGDLTFGDPAPLAVARDLARLHAAWELRRPPPGLRTYDSALVLALHANAVAALKAAALFDGESRLAALGADCALARLAEALPRTLTHGDVHPGNIIAGPDGRFTLIDWGNAAAAPGMLDLAHTVAIEDEAWTAYLSAYEAAGGRLGAADQSLAWRWARGVGALMYLPWTAQHRPAAVPGLIAQAFEAETALAGAAAGPLG